MLKFLLLALTLAATAAAADPAQWRGEWPDTDFSRASVDFADILSGGPPKDGIPAIDAPTFRSVADEQTLSPREPVLTLEVGDEARAYPIRYLIWHEIVNDTVAGIPVAVTFCPLCNTAMVFDRRVAGRTLSFGVSGKLRFSDMIMYDRETESWWQQALGQGIVGTHMGTDLVQLPSIMESWDQFRARHPKGLVMAEPDWPRSYGANPYAGYDSSTRPFLYDGEDPPYGIHPLARVLRVGNRAWTLERLRAERRIEEADLILTWEEGQASALDTARIDRGAEVGTVRVTDRTGAAVAHDLPFAFAFHAFHPQGEWMIGG
jgi:Protein of unknown function (DUF3179)